MSEIQRYGSFNELLPKKKGLVVLYADHLAEVQRLREQVRVLRDAAQFISHLSAESYSPWADGLRMTRAALAQTETRP